MWDEREKTLTRKIDMDVLGLTSRELAKASKLTSLERLGKREWWFRGLALKGSLGRRRRLLIVKIDIDDLGLIIGNDEDDPISFIQAKRVDVEVFWFENFGVK